MTLPTPPVVIDLHTHLPMQLDPASQDVRAHLRRAMRREKLLDRLKFAVLQLAELWFNREQPWDGRR